MTPVVLTDEQRQALQAERGNPVEVVDPATQERYVLLTREQFERLNPPPAPATAAGGPRGGKPLRQAIRDLPLPPEVAAEAIRYCKRLGLWRARYRRQMEEQMKLQHYYGGLWIAYLRTDVGSVVVAAAESLNDPLFDEQLSFLTPEERRAAVIDSPPQLFDEQSAILTPYSHES
jgi:hypothetical protein